MPNL
ncbi:rCG38917, isoform CRA_b [Rattus norvegicus]|jgi:hypothetical protein